MCVEQLEVCSELYKDTHPSITQSCRQKPSLLTPQSPLPCPSTVTGHECRPLTSVSEHFPEFHEGLREKTPKTHVSRQTPREKWQLTACSLFAIVPNISRWFHSVLMAGQGWGRGTCYDHFHWEGGPGDLMMRSISGGSWQWRWIESKNGGSVWLSSSPAF